MKVYEIISKDIVDEGLGGSVLLGRGAAAIGRGIGKFIPSSSEMALAGNVTAKGMLGNIAAMVPGISLTLEIAKPISEYNEKINGFQKAVALGNKTQDEFDKYREQRATVLVEILAMQIGGYIISKAGFGVLSWILNKTPGLKALGAKLGGIGNADKNLGKVANAVTTGAKTSAIAYLMNSLNNEEARKSLTAIVLFGEDKTWPGQLFVNAVDFLSKKIDSAAAYATGKEQPVEKVATKPATIGDRDQNVYTSTGLKWAHAPGANPL
jgi:hypothetical protein